MVLPSPLLACWGLSRIPLVPCPSLVCAEVYKVPPAKTHPPFVPLHLNHRFSRWSTLFFPPFPKAPGPSMSTERMPILWAQVQAVMPEISPSGRMPVLAHPVTLESVCLRDAPASTRSWHTTRFRWQAALCSAVSPLNQRLRNQARVGDR